YTDVDLQMPPKGKLPAAAVADLTAWVRMGAPWPDAPVADAPGSPKAFDLHKRKAEHWAWRPVRATPPPAVRDATWPLTPGDRLPRPERPAVPRLRHPRPERRRAVRPARRRTRGRRPAARPAAAPGRRVRRVGPGHRVLAARRDGPLPGRSAAGPGRPPG